MTEATVTTRSSNIGNQRRRRNGIAVMRQYLAEKQYSLLIPVEILALYWVISAVIVLFIGIKAGLPLPVSMQLENAKGNIGGVMSVPWFLVTAGALCVNRQFNAALAFGSTRRDFWFGTLLGFLTTSVATGLFALLGLMLEKATNHWWFGVHAFDVSVLGSGSYRITFATMFFLSLTSLLAGATFGTIFRSFGTPTLICSILGTVIVLLGTAALFIWQSTAILNFFAPWGYWTLSAFLASACLIMSAVGYWVNQHASA